MIDVDRFKQINDTYGHAEGDRALVIVSDALKMIDDHIKMPVFIGRYGGDEFTVCVQDPTESDDTPERVAEILRKILEEKQEENHLPYDLKISIGDVTTVALRNGADLRIRVIGILAEPTRYLLPQKLFYGYAGVSGFTLEMMVSDISSAIIIREEDLSAQKIGSVSELTSSTPNLFIFAREDASEQELEEAVHRWNRYGEISSMESLITGYNNSLAPKVIRGAVLLIYYLCVFTAIGLINNLVQSMRNERRFTVYYLCGMNWKQSTAVEATRIGLLVLMMLPIAVLGGKLGWWAIGQTASRTHLFFGFIFLYFILLFAAVSAGFLIRLTKTDIAAKLKDIRQSE